MIKPYYLRTSVTHNPVESLYQTQYDVIFTVYSARHRWRAMTEIFNMHEELNRQYGSFSEKYSYVSIYLAMDKNTVHLETKSLEDLLLPLKYEDEVDYLDSEASDYR